MTSLAIPTPPQRIEDVVTSFFDDHAIGATKSNLIDYAGLILDGEIPTDARRRDRLGKQVAKAIKRCPAIRSTATETDVPLSFKGPLVVWPQRDRHPDHHKLADLLRERQRNRRRGEFAVMLYHIRPLPDWLTYGLRTEHRTPASRTVAVLEMNAITLRLIATYGLHTKVNWDLEPRLPANGLQHATGSVALPEHFESPGMEARAQIQASPTLNHATIIRGHDVGVTTLQRFHRAFWCLAYESQGGPIQGRIDDNGQPVWIEQPYPPPPGGMIVREGKLDEAEYSPEVRQAYEKALDEFIEADELPDEFVAHCQYQIW